ncbi:fded2f18-4f63-4ce9-be03-11a47de6e403-CDS [Sclerotinia trifoliorum]|uniref:Fded2f18-4f63-4ce9-be03-11a47de6e403-CDS n=1 Tax=Sclerotinia trifoliorum TaxID=28548 RepID=A0A8H2W1I3_9HELO|nr:fded2f18-4f63-4ce9-be03-11a47de6e403-CDS [Sclerotinia trifoliorum]
MDQIPAPTNGHTTFEPSPYSREEEIRNITRYVRWLKSYQFTRKTRMAIAGISRMMKDDELDRDILALVDMRNSMIDEGYQVGEMEKKARELTDKWRMLNDQLSDRVQGREVGFLAEKNVGG